jgi:hypothetical protein
MIEIAISLAVIAFALVAIIGILPAGMTVQKENREETIINQEAKMFMSALSSGARRMDELTNYVYAITNYAALCAPNGKITAPFVVGYTSPASTAPNPLLINGDRIVGLLSTPWKTPDPATVGGFYSNHVVAYVRSMSGAAFEKKPQDNTIVLDAAFSYRLIPEVHAYDAGGYWDPSWTNYTDPSITVAESATRSNYWLIVRNLQNNMYDVRLIFRWPILPNGGVGPGHQLYRTMASGVVYPTSDNGFPLLPQALYFFQPRTYVQAP